METSVVGLLVFSVLNVPLGESPKMLASSKSDGSVALNCSSSLRSPKMSSKSDAMLQEEKGCAACCFGARCGSGGSGSPREHEHEHANLDHEQETTPLNCHLKIEVVSEHSDNNDSQSTFESFIASSRAHHFRRCRIALAGVSFVVH